MDDLQSLQQAAYENNLPRNSTVPPTSILVWGLVLLAVAQVYTFLQLRQLKTSLMAQRVALQADASGSQPTDVENRLSALEDGYRRVLRSERKQGRDDLGAVISRVDSTQDQLKRNVSMVQSLREEQKRSAQELGRKLGTKADQAQVGMLSGNVSKTRTDLASTNRKLAETIAQLGMTRSQLGTLIARNHTEIAKLRELGERDYFEFTLYRSARPQAVGGVGLRLRKTDSRKLRYAVDVYADDYRMEKKGRGINEPLFFYVHESKQPVELVVNDIQENRISGYVSAAKGTMHGWSLPNPDWEPFQELKRRPTGPETHAAAGLPPTGALQPN